MAKKKVVVAGDADDNNGGSSNPDNLDIGFLVNSHILTQKLRVASGNRVTHLGKAENVDQRAVAIHSHTAELEKMIEKYIAEYAVNHVTWPWTSRINGCGKEAAPKVIGIIEGTNFKATGRGGIYAFDMPSHLRRYAGFAPIDGIAEKRVKGHKSHYNHDLKVMLWRLMLSLKKQKGVWYDKYHSNHEFYTKKALDSGMQIIPSLELPKNEKGKLYEPEGIISLGHVEARAGRKTITLWLDLLWVYWREALGLSTRTPWVLEYGGHHTLIRPEDMVDKPF